MVKIRLQRFGTKKRPFYRIVAADSRRARDGKFLEVLGTYDPMNLNLPKGSDQAVTTGLVEVKTDRIQYWIGVGAQMSDSVKSILKREKALPHQLPADSAAA